MEPSRKNQVLHYPSRLATFALLAAPLRRRAGNAGNGNGHGGAGLAPRGATGAAGGEAEDGGAAGGATSPELLGGSGNLMVL